MLGPKGRQTSHALGARPLASYALLSSIAFAATPALADPSPARAEPPAAHADPAGALDELKQGYALKQEGNCREALVHFTRSYRLDPKPKAILNMADCEQRSGDLLSARDHAIEGRDLAREKKSTELVALAGEQIAALERRLPKLTIALAPDAPPGTAVMLDGGRIDAVALGGAISVNPGAHVVTALTAGRLEHTMKVELAEEATQTIVLSPGPPIGASEPAGGDRKRGGPFAAMGTQKILALGAAGAGVAGLVVGVVAGLAAGSKHDVLAGECPDGRCPASAQGDLDSFHGLKTASTVGYVLGVAAVAGGAALWLTAPRAPRSGVVGIGIGPASVRIGGAF